MGEYTAPELEDLGSIAEFTKYIGETSTTDQVFDGTNPNEDPTLIGTEEGSRDVILVPK